MNALCVIWCGRVFLRGIGCGLLVVSGKCFCDLGSVRNKVVLVWVESGSSLPV